MLLGALAGVLLAETPTARAMGGTPARRLLVGAVLGALAGAALVPVVALLTAALLGLLAVAALVALGYGALWVWRLWAAHRYSP